MSRPIEEELMAYADGTLPSDRRREIESHLAVTPDDRALVDRLRSSARLARDAVDDIGMQPRPDLVAMIRDSAPSSIEGRDETATVIPYLKRPWRTASPPRYAVPLAAGLALAVGFGSGYLTRDFRVAQDVFAIGTVASNTPIALVLESAASGTPSAQHRTLQVVATFFDQTSRPCREIERLETAGGKQPVAAAIACRGPGGWTIEGAARVAASAATSATKPSGTADRDALTGVLDSLGAKPSMTRADEQRLIERGWR